MKQIKLGQKVKDKITGFVGKSWEVSQKSRHTGGLAEKPNRAY